MKRFNRIILILILSFSSFFMCIGYASITDELTISGTVENAVQNNVFITDIVQVSDEDQGILNVNGYIDTTLNSSLTLSSVNSEVTYRLTLHNNNSSTDFYYWENVYIDDFYSNENISFRLSVNQFDTISKNGDKTIDITFYYSGDKTVENPELTLNGVIKLNFKEVEGTNKITITVGDEVINGFVDESGAVEIEKELPEIVAIRANNGTIPSYNSDTNVLTLSSVTTETSVEAFYSMTEAINENSGGFANDTSENNIILIADNEAEPGIEAIVNQGRSFNIDFNNKNIITTVPLINKGTLNIVENDGYNGYLISSNRTAIINYSEQSTLNINRVAIRTDGDSDVAPYNSDNGGAIIVYGGNVNITNGYVHSRQGNAIYKRSLTPGVVGRKSSSKTDKVFISDTIIRSTYNDAILVADGSGFISMVNTDVQSGYCHSIVSRRHILETSTDFDGYYKNAINDMKIYMTGGSISHGENKYHYASSTNTRLYYTASVVKQIDYDDAESFDTNFRMNDVEYPTNYPVAAVNGQGNGEDNGYLDQDGWYYIKIKETSGEMEYLLNDEGERVRVGDKVRVSNFNSPELYFRGDCYNDENNYIEDPSDMSAELTFVEFGSTHNGFKTDILSFLTFLVSSQENYINLTLLAYPDVACHLEQPSDNYDYSVQNVGIKYVSNRINSISLPLDNVNQRFMIVRNTDLLNGNATSVLFKTIFNSVLAYYTFPQDKWFNPNDVNNQNGTVITGNTAVSGSYAISNAQYPDYKRNRWDLSYE